MKEAKTSALHQQVNRLSNKETALVVHLLDVLSDQLGHQSEQQGEWGQQQDERMFTRKS